MSSTIGEIKKDGSLSYPYDHQLVLTGLLHRISPCIAAEVGVATGRTSEYLLYNVPNLTLVMVDPYQCPTEHPRRTQEQYDQVAQLAYGRTEFAGHRRYVCYEMSVLAAAKFSDGFFGLVFIDANHKYHSVMEDCIAWWPKVRPGGILCGHDYFSPRNASGQWGVKRAVDEFVAANNLTLGFDKTVWIIRKPYN